MKQQRNINSPERTCIILKGGAAALTSGFLPLSHPGSPSWLVTSPEMNHLCLPSVSCLYDLLIFEHFLTCTARYSGLPYVPALTLDSAISRGALVSFRGVVFGNQRGVLDAPLQPGCHSFLASEWTEKPVCMCAHDCM